MLRKFMRGALYVAFAMVALWIIVKGEDGQPMHPKNTPYNPIEKE